MRILVGCAAVALMATAACSSQQSAEAPANDTMAAENGSAAMLKESATADLRDAAGKTVGTATASQENDGLHVSVSATGLPAGSHGIHLHMTGLCEAPEFTSAGGHWNPTDRQHGKDNPEGAHMGDLPNLEVAADGTGTVEFTVPGGTISGPENALLDNDGTAFVVHADADDYRTDPSGNSGARIACGVFN